jgi:hypothetical protein
MSKEGRTPFDPKNPDQMAEAEKLHAEKQTFEFILRHVEQQAEAGGLAEPSPVKFGASSQGPYWSEAAWNNLVKQSLSAGHRRDRSRQTQSW